MEIIKSKRDLVNEAIYIMVGIIIMNLAFYLLLIPSELVIGGVIGIATMLEKLRIPLSLSILILNIVFLFIGLLALGKTFFLKTIFGSLFSPLVVFVMEITIKDPNILVNQLSEPLRVLISAVLGSIIVGSGLGLIFRNGGSTGGIDIPQIIMNKKYHRNYLFAFLLTDGLVVMAGLFVYQDIEKFLFSIMSVLLSSLVIENISIKGRAGHTLFIVTNKTEEVKNAIFETIERGVTIIDAKGGFSGEKKQLVICVITTRELNLTRLIVEQVDKDAFTFIAQTKEAVGYGFTHK